MAQETLIEQNRQRKHKEWGTWSTHAESLCKKRKVVTTLVRFTNDILKIYIYGTDCKMMKLLLGQTWQKWICVFLPWPLTATHADLSRALCCWLCRCSCGPDMIMASARAICNPPFWLPSLDIVLQSQPCYFAGHLDRQDPKNAICLVDSSTLIFSRPFFFCHCLPWQHSDHYRQGGAENAADNVNA